MMMNQVDLNKRAAFTIGAKTAAAIGLTAATFPTVWAKKAKYHATMVTSWPGILDGFWTPIDRLCKHVHDISEGEFVIEAVKPGELVGGLEVYDATASGAAQMGHTASYYYIGKSPVHGIFTTIPYGMTSAEYNAWYTQDSALNLYRDFLKKDNLTWLPSFGTGTQMGGWFRKPIDSVADLKGLKMRIPGLGGKAMSLLGVNVQVLAGGDIFPALERGAIDATEWVGPHDDLKFGFDKIAPFYYYPGWHEPGAITSLYVNLDFYNTLPEKYQILLANVNDATAAFGSSNIHRLNAIGLEQIKNNGKVTLRRFPMDVQKALLAASRQVMDDSVQKDADFARIWEIYNAQLKKYRAYLAVSDYAYACDSVKLTQDIL